MIEAHNPPFCQTAVTGSAFTHLGLFEGIGGFSLAAHWMGWKTTPLYLQPTNRP